ncbi:MAG: hypothetical protein IJ593_00500 [Lachnospiraceae bacterium]|nr:hypothetical protein [Lachnospiraceae bacterium]
MEAFDKINDYNKLLLVNSKYMNQNIVNKNIDNMIHSSLYSYEYEGLTEKEKNELVSEKRIALEECFTITAIKLFREINIKKAFDTYGEKKVVEQVLRMDNYYERFSKIEIEMDITDEELDRFIKYSYDKEENMKPYDDEMTGRKFLKLCRLCYDAAPKYPFPKDVSDFYVYSSMKGGNLEHEYYHVLSEEIDIDSPKDFVKYHNCGYHTEELKFGGPCISFTHHNIFQRGKNRWTAHFYGKSEKEWRTIKMYLALRDNGYPVEILEPEKVISGYLTSSKIYSRDSWYGHKHYVKSAEEAIKLAKKLNEKGE